MPILDPLSNAFVAIMQNEARGNRECLIVPASNLIANVLRVMQKEGYIGEIELIDDGRGGKIRVQLLGRINGCGAIRPRFPAELRELDGWARKFLPSRDFGAVILSTSVGVMTHGEAVEKGLGGVLLGYVF